MAKKKIIGEDGKTYVVKEKRSKKQILIAVIVGVLFVIIFNALSSGGSDDKKTSSDNQSTTTQKETKKEEKKTYGLNQDVQVGDVLYNVHGVEVSKSVGEGYSKTDAKGTFVIVSLTVTNKGDEAITVDSKFFTLLNGSKKYESESMATITANQTSYNSDFFLDKVNPDLSIEGKVVFDVSEEVANSTSKQLQVQTGTFGTQKDIINLQ